MKPLLPAIDAARLLREAGFALLLRDRRPLELAELADTTGLGVDAVARAVTSLAEAGYLDLDDSRRVVGAAGLSLTTGPHILSIADQTFRTWCAYDALGILAALAADGRVETTCGLCAAPIGLEFRAGIPERTGPERLWLSGGGADLRGAFCTPTILLCNEAHGLTWAESQDGNGQLLDLAAGARQGAGEWAGCAAAVRRLA